MIFKKNSLQGNALMPDGTQLLFENNHFKTDDPAQIAYLKSMNCYEVVQEAPAPAPVKELPSGAGTLTSVKLMK